MDVYPVQNNDFKNASRIARMQDAPIALQILYASYKKSFVKHKLVSREIHIFNREHGAYFRVLRKQRWRLRRKKRILEKKINTLKRQICGNQNNDFKNASRNARKLDAPITLHRLYGSYKELFVEHKHVSREMQLLQAEHGTELSVLQKQIGGLYQKKYNLQRNIKYTKQRICDTVAVNV